LEPRVKSVSAREANHSFSRVLGEAEAGEEIVITRHGKPVAVLGPYRSSLDMPERRAAVEHAIRLMENAPDLGTARRFSRDEMHER
jgi:prevent-host-death family protein